MQSMVELPNTVAFCTAFYESDAHRLPPALLRNGEPTQDVASDLNCLTAMTAMRTEAEPVDLKRCFRADHGATALPTHQVITDALEAPPARTAQAEAECMQRAARAVFRRWRFACARRRDEPVLAQLAEQFSLKHSQTMMNSKQSGQHKKQTRN